MTTTNYTINQTTQATKENTADLDLIETVYALNNGSSYLSDIFYNENDANEEADSINKQDTQRKKECGTVKVYPVQIWIDGAGETHHFHL